MGIYIKGMEMPKDCIVCPFGWNGCNKQHDFVYMGSRPDFCPLIDANEPHGRLGDLDRLEQMFADIDNAPYSGFDGTEPFYSAEDAAQIIRLAPTIIEAEG